MNLTKVRIEIGLSKPLHFLHISDSHLCYADGRDNERKQLLAEQRRIAFEGTDSGCCIRNLEEAVAHAAEHCDLLLHTGDLIDFVSWRNLDLVREKLAPSPYFFATGNHEFSLYVGEALEDVAYKMQSMPMVQPAFGNDLLFASLRRGGVNLVAVDNSYYQFDRSQLEKFQAEVAKGEPILLLLHTPLYTDELYDEMMVRRGKECAYLAGTPENGLACYGEARRLQQQPTPETLEFIEYVKRQPLVKAVLAGHLHFDYNFSGALSEYTTQYVVGGGYYHCAFEFELI